MGIHSVYLTLFASVTLLAAGCADGRFSFSYYDNEPRPARVAHVYRHTGHICTPDCHEHYWDGGRILVLSGHRHHRGCGHIWDGGHWVVVGKARAGYGRGHKAKVKKVKHIHGHSCGCAFDGRGHKWVTVKRGHVHRRGCGHRFIDGRWTIRIGR